MQVKQQTMKCSRIFVINDRLNDVSIQGVSHVHAGCVRLLHA